MGIVSCGKGEGLRLGSRQPCSNSALAQGSAWEEGEGNARLVL